jgi:hypothetical protein
MAGVLRAQSLRWPRPRDHEQRSLKTVTPGKGKKGASAHLSPPARRRSLKPSSRIADVPRREIDRHRRPNAIQIQRRSHPADGIPVVGPRHREGRTAAFHTETVTHIRN